MTIVQYYFGIGNQITFKLFCGYSCTYRVPFINAGICSFVRNHCAIILKCLKPASFSDSHQWLGRTFLFVFLA